MLVASCDNFFSGNLIQEELQELIDEANAPEVEIYIAADADTGTVAPNGIVTHKVGKSFPVIFTESKGYQFLYWEVLDRETKEKVEDILTISDSRDSETRFTVTSNVPNLYIHPVCIKRPSIDRATPAYEDKGVPKDSSIVITFSKNISKDNDFSKISITSGGVSVKDCYKAPVINNNILTFAANPSNLIEVSSETKTISVTIPKDFYYVEDKNVVSIGSEYSWQFKVNNTTEEKAEITFAVDKDKGTISPESTIKYNIGETVKLKYEASNQYTFKSWNILDSEGKKVDKNIVKIEDENNSNTTFTVLGSMKGITITPNCIQIPKVVSFTPEKTFEGVLCYKTIIITFNMPMCKEDLHETFKNINIQNAYGALINDCFYNPSLSEDGKTLRIRPRENKITSLFENTTLANIRVVLKKGIKAKDNNGINLEESEYEYTVNKTAVNTKPIISTIDFFKGTDTKISNHKFNSSEWIEDDYEKNHIVGDIYIQCVGLAKDNPITGIQITESLIFDKLGNQLTGNNIITKTQEINDIKFNEIDNQTFQSEKKKVSLKSTQEGIIKITIKLKDVENHYSENYIDYYVINDNSFGKNVKLNFGKQNVQNYCEQFGIFADANGKGKVLLNKITSLNNEFYKGHYTPLNVKIDFWEENDSSKQTIFTLNNFTEASGEKLLNLEITKDCNKTSYIELSISDNYGRSYSVQYCIPISIGVAKTEINSDRLKVYLKDISSPKYTKSFERRIIFRESGNNDTIQEGTTVYVNNTADIDFSKLTAGKSYDIGFNFKYDYSTYGCISDYVTIKYLGSKQIEVQSPGFTLPSVEKQFTKTAANNEGFLKCKLNLPVENLPQNCLLQPYLTYTSNGTKVYLCINNPNEFYLTSGIQYNLYYALKDKVSGYVYNWKDYGSIDLRGDVDSNDPEYNPNAETGYGASQLKPNELKFPVSNKIIETNGGANIASKFAVYLDENPITNKYYACYPTSAVSSEIQQKINNSNNYISIVTLTVPLTSTIEYYYAKFDIPDSLTFAAYGRAYNVNNNYITKGLTGSFAFSTEVSDKNKFDFEASKGSTDAYILGSNDSGGDYSVTGIDGFDSSNNKWVDEKNGYSNYSTNGANNAYIKFDTLNSSKYYRIDHQYCKKESGTEKEKYFFKTLYIHSDYITAAAKKCSSKNYIAGANGIQIISDKPILIQTLYTKGNYGTDADLWATKALEADVRYESGSCTYSLTNEILNKIPSGSNYCTVIHFVDGSTLMTDVKTKQ